MVDLLVSVLLLLVVSHVSAIEYFDGLSRFIVFVETRGRLVAKFAIQRVVTAVNYVGPQLVALHDPVFH